ncbi:MAG TPA: hypothetical protein VF384_07550 [Planctomycetota bacterium]
MTGEAGHEHRQRLLESLLSGERSTADAEVQTAMRADERFAREVGDLQGLQAMLSRRAAEAREDLAHSAPGLEDAVAAAVRARGREHVGVARRWWLWLAAALLVSFALFAWPRTLPDVPQHLGGDFKVEATADGRGVQFHWTLKSGAAFAVQVLDEAGKIVLPEVRVESSTWIPDPRLVAAWPDVVSVRVEVRSSDTTGSPPTGELRAWRIR